VGSVLDPNIARAIDWMVLLRSGEASAADQAAFEAWRASDPRHEEASRQMCSVLAPVERLRHSGVSSQVMGRAVSRASRRAALRSAFMFTGVSVSAGLLGWQVVQESDFTADERTGIAQRRESLLPKGGALVLDARTAVDIATDEASRQLVTLRRGRLLADTIGHTAALILRTDEGVIHASGARFVAQALEDKTKLTVVGGKVSAALASGDRVQVASGQQLVLSARAQPTLAPARGAEDLWTRGFMILNNEPLGELVAVLQNYRSGLLRIDEEAARIKVSGVFSLDDTDSTLRALASTQPVRVNERTKYWVTISAA
jgi:transmembrane sensor